MAGGLKNESNNDDFFSIGWFRFPIDLIEDHEAIEIVHDIMKFIAFFSNFLLLWIIFKNPGSKTRSASSYFLTNISLVNIIVCFVGLLYFLSDIVRPDGPNIISYKTGSIVMSILVPKYYAWGMLLTLNNYGIIVEPLKFKTLEPKTTRFFVIITIVLWVDTTAVFLITPLFVNDFDLYMKITITVVVSICWLVTIVMVAMHVKMLIALRRRAIALRSTFNVAVSSQGLMVIEQNKRLAKVLFIFISVTVICTLPLYTSYLFVIHCPSCNQRGNLKFSLYMLILFFMLPCFYSAYWLIGNPQYYKELKRLVRRLLVCCHILKNEQNET